MLNYRTLRCSFTRPGAMACAVPRPCASRKEGSTPSIVRRMKVPGQHPVGGFSPNGAGGVDNPTGRRSLSTRKPLAAPWTAFLRNTLQFAPILLTEHFSIDTPVQTCTAVAANFGLPTLLSILHFQATFRNFHSPSATASTQLYNPFCGGFCV